MVSDDDHGNSSRLIEGVNWPTKAENPPDDFFDWEPRNQVLWYAYLCRKYRDFRNAFKQIKIYNTNITS